MVTFLYHYWLYYDEAAFQIMPFPEGCHIYGCVIRSAVLISRVVLAKCQLLN